MKKSKRFFITGSVQPILFNRFIKDHADRIGVRGFVRKLEDGRMEIFIEGNTDSVESMSQICRRGPPHSQLRGLEEKDERFQGFTDFRILRI